MRATFQGDTLELRDEAADSLVTFVPARGAIATRFRVGARDVLYLDESTLRDPTKNVRGGVPLLFPSPGRLTGDRWAQAGRSGAMKQHGFARNEAWQATPHADRDAARATLTLASNDATLAQYPWPFRLELTATLRAATLRLDLVVANTGDARMPFGFGIHPYFLVTDKARARIATGATQAFDNVTKQVVPFAGFSGAHALTAPEVDLHLLDHGGSESALDGADAGRIELRASSEHRRWVVWTVAGKDFVCVEPWTAPGDALNTGDSLLWLEPGATRSLWVELTCVA